MAKRTGRIVASAERKMREEVMRAMRAAEAIGISREALVEYGLAPVFAIAAALTAPRSAAAVREQRRADALRLAAPASVPDAALFAISLCACAYSDGVSGDEDIDARLSLASYGSGAFFGIMTAAGDQQLAKLFVSRAMSDTSKRAKRGPRRPKLDKWLDSQNLDLTASELFLSIPEDGIDLYRDGDRVIEVHGDRELPGLVQSSFNNAVSRARKRSRGVRTHS